MKYGAYSDLVKEVIDFSNTMDSHKKGSIPKDIFVINEFEKIEDFAFEKLYGEDEYTWSDIRQLEMSKVKGKLYRLRDDEKPKELDLLLDIISEGLRRHITDSYSKFFESVVVDLKNCAVNRSVNGRAINFYEKMFKIYQTGGFPCGWDGEYPEGRIVAYYPKEVDL
ncbi:hypothetical protein NL50_13810 [Clostridium acetobutylicum]|nr:hypothetical protein NL50_13810 [Clostridium acetobutylicum]